MCTFHRSVLQRPRLRLKTRVNPVRLLGCWECGDRRLKLFSMSGMIKSANVLPMTYWQDQPQTGAKRKHQVTSRPLLGLRRLDRIPGHDSQFDSRALSPHGVRSLQGLVWYSSCKDVWATKGIHHTLQRRERGVPRFVFILHLHELAEGQRSVGAESCPKTAQILSEDENNASHACLKLGVSSLLPSDAGYRGFFISLRITFTCPSGICLIGTSISN